MATSKTYPTFTRESIRAVDHAAIEEFGVPGIVLMENAARGLLDHAMNMLAKDESTVHRQVIIFCGAGNNGGDGFALARHLHNRGVPLMLTILAEPSELSDAGVNRSICRRMRIPEMRSIEFTKCDFERCALVVDALFGTGLDRPIERSSEPGRLIGVMNQCARPILAVDVPSGLDCDTGRPFTVDSPCTRATKTATLGGWKVGFHHPDARRWLGDVVVCDIGAPRELIERFACLA